MRLMTRSRRRRREKLPSLAAPFRGLAMTLTLMTRGRISKETQFMMKNNRLESNNELGVGRAVAAREGGRRRGS